MEENPKIKLLIDLGLKKLKDMLGEAKRLVSSGSADMKSKLDEIKIKKPDTSQFNEGLNDMKRAAQQAKNDINNSLNGVKTPTAGSSIKDKLFDVLGNGFKGGQSFAEGGELEGLQGMLSGAAEGGGGALLAAGSIAAGIGIAIMAGKKLWDMMSESSAAIEKNEATIAAAFGVTGRELDTLTAKGMASSSVLDKNFNELAATAKNVSDAYADSGVNADKAFTLIQKGLIASNDLMKLSDIDEYIYKLRELGLNSDNAIAFIAGESAKGNMGNKLLSGLSAADANIRAMRKSTAGALSDLGLDPKEITKKLSSGALQVKDIIAEIGTQIDKVSVKAQQEAVNIFSKNLTKSQIESLKDMNIGTEELIQKQGSHAAQLLKELQIQQQINEAQASYASLVNDVNDKIEILKLEGKKMFYDMIAEGMDYLSDYKDEFKAVFDFIAGSIEFIVKVFGSAVRFIMADINIIAAGLKLAWGEGKLEFSYLVDSIMHGLKLGKYYFQDFGQYVVAIIHNVANAWEKVKNLDFQGAKDALFAKITTDADNRIAKENVDYKARMADYGLQQHKIVEDFTNSFKKSAVNSAKAIKDLLSINKKDEDPLSDKSNSKAGSSNGKLNSGNLNNDVSKIAHESQQSRNINITFDSYIKGDVITQNQNIRNMNSEEFQRWLADNFQRLLLSVQQSYGGN